MIEKIGGRGGTRTPDPLLAKQVLCQLSYTPSAFVPRTETEVFMLQRLSDRRNWLPGSVSSPVAAQT